MSRPTNMEKCAVCFEAMTLCQASDLSGDPNDLRTHLQFMYDLRLARSGAPEAEFTHQLELYALNRYLAPFRDNLNKKQGKQATRIVKSRNTRTSDVLGKKCHVRRGATQCMRNAGHPDDDGRGGHRF